MSDQLNPSQDRPKESSSPKEYLISDRSEKFLDIPLLWKILHFAKDYKWAGVITFIVLISSQALPFLAPHLLQEIIDKAIPSGEFERILWILTIYLAAAFVHSLTMYGASYLSKYLAFEIIHKLRLQLFAKVQKLHMEFFHRTPVGRLMTRMTSDVDSLNTLFSEGLLDLLSSVFMLIFAVIFMFAKSWELALTTTLVFPLMVVITSIFRVKVRDINRIIRGKVAQLNAVLQENLNGINLIQIFGKELHRSKVFDKINGDYKKAYIKNVLYYSVFFPGLFSLADFSLIALYIVGINLVIGGDTSVGTLVAFAWYASMFQRPLREISDKITQLQGSIAAGERVFTLMETDAEDMDGQQVMLGEGLSIDFKQVSFYYNTEKPILKNLSFSIKTGERIAIVGATGSGKSTVMNLVNRFYRPQEGLVSFNNIPINDLQRESLRNRLAYVSQDVFLFSSTIRDNIILDLEIDDTKVWEILDNMRAKDFIAGLPKGLDTPLRENGSNLSAGQRQLISFARAIAQDPDLLLLDEATSSVDTDTEELIQDALEALLKGRTSIVVAHRLSTIINSDRIFVFHHGEIVETGSHEALMEMSGIYSQLVRLNNSGFEKTKNEEK